MTWLRVDLSGEKAPAQADPGSARARRLALRARLLAEPGLQGATALALAREMRELELREAADSLQSLHQI